MSTKSAPRFDLCHWLCSAASCALRRIYPPVDFCFFVLFFFVFDDVGKSNHDCIFHVFYDHRVEKLEFGMKTALTHFSGYYFQEVPMTH